MGDGQTDFTLELTWLADRKEPYDLGESEFHLCLRVGGNYDEIREAHRKMDCICYENTDMGLYFICDRTVTGSRSYPPNKFIPATQTGISPHGCRNRSF